MLVLKYETLVKFVIQKIFGKIQKNICLNTVQKKIKNKKQRRLARSNIYFTPKM